MDNDTRTPPVSRLRSAVVRWTCRLVLMAAVAGCSTAGSCGGGGSNSCQKCRDDCTANNIPASQCNCQGCTP